MDDSRLQALTDWIAAHPLAAGLLVAGVALADALPVAGMLVPSMAILLAVGALLGLGVLDPAWILICAALGAMLGDGIGYAIGRRYGQQLRKAWPFSRYPGWLDQGERLFERRGAWAVVIGRQVGAIRPFIPAVAGMLGMRSVTFFGAASVGAAIWTLAYLGPGWLLGKSWALLSAVAGRLGLLLLICTVAMLATVWLARRLYCLLAPRIGGWLDRLAGWARAHPRMGRPLRGLLDPKAPESAALILFALGLVLSTALGLSLLALGEPRSAAGLDLRLAEAVRTLRHPFADAWMLRLLPLTGAAFAAVSAIPGLLWLVRRRRWLALIHALGAVLAAAFAALALGLSVPLPAGQPGLHSALFQPIANGPLLATAIWTFLAVLLADGMPRKSRAWPYVLAALVGLGASLPRLYLGLHWPSALCASLLLGAAIGALFGIAYRRHERARIWLPPLRRAQLGGAAALAAAWLLLLPPAPREVLPVPPVAKLDGGTEVAARLLPRHREDFGSARRWPLDLLWAGEVAALSNQLVDLGWDPVRPAEGLAALSVFDFRAQTAHPPRLPASHEGAAEVLLMRRSASAGGEWQLRMWPTAWQDAAGRPLYLGHVGRFVEERPYGLWRRWRWLADERLPPHALPAVLARPDSQAIEGSSSSSR